MVPISTLRQMVRAVHKIPVLWKNIEREFTIGFADGTKTGKTVRMAFHFRKVPDPSDHESRWLVSGHDFTGCGKTHVLYQGAALWLRKHSCFVSGHDFSRAVKSTAMRALAPGFFFASWRKTRCREAILRG